VVSEKCVSGTRHLKFDLELPKIIEEIHPFKYESARVAYARIERQFQEDYERFQRKSAEVLAELWNIYLG